MFGNRGYGWKLAGALAIIAGLLVCANARSERVKPAIWKCVVDPEAWTGTEVWITAATVISASEGVFVIAVEEHQIAVRSPERVKAGQAVAVAGIFRAEGGPHIEARRLRRLVPGRSLRWLVELVSGAVLLLILVNLFRRFSFRPEVLRVEVSD